MNNRRYRFFAWIDRTSDSDAYKPKEKYDLANQIYLLTWGLLVALIGLGLAQTGAFFWWLNRKLEVKKEDPASA